MIGLLLYPLKYSVCYETRVPRGDAFDCLENIWRSDFSDIQWVFGRIYPTDVQHINDRYFCFRCMSGLLQVWHDSCYITIHEVQ
jgi:hypothetical protein